MIRRPTITYSPIAGAFVVRERGPASAALIIAHLAGRFMASMIGAAVIGLGMWAFVEAIR